ncbi:unnamed protein product, partial [Phaeothamnion confervicola]
PVQQQKATPRPASAQSKPKQQASSGPVRRNAPASRQARAAVAPYAQEPRKPSVFLRLGAKAVEGTKVSISNLNFDVMQNDLEDLFNELGEVLDLKVKYDRSGRSLGEAVVTFAQRNDAVKAVRELHMRTLDDTPMHLKLLGAGNEAHANGSGGGVGGNRARGYSDAADDRQSRPSGANVREGIFGTAIAGGGGGDGGGGRGNGGRGGGGAHTRPSDDVHFSVTLDGK